MNLSGNLSLHLAVDLDEVETAVIETSSRGLCLELKDFSLKREIERFRIIGRMTDEWPALEVDTNHETQTVDRGVAVVAESPFPTDFEANETVSRSFKGDLIDACLERERSFLWADFTREDDGVPVSS